MIKSILQIGYLNSGLVFFESLLGVIILYSIVKAIAYQIFEVDEEFLKKNKPVALRSIFVAFFFVMTVRIFFGIFGLFNDPLIFFALMATIFFPPYLVYFKKTKVFQPKKKYQEIDETHIEEKFKKSIIFCLGLIWIISLMISLPVFFIRRQNLNLGNFFNRDKLDFFSPAYSSLTIFCLGLEWALITVFFAKKITSLINNVRSIEKKIPERVLERSSSLASLITFGFWAFQLIIVELYFYGSQRGIVQDIRVMILVLTVLYIFSFTYLLKKKFLPKALEKSTKELRYELLMREEKEDKNKKMTSKDNNVILDVQDLVTYFYTEEGVVRAVEGVSFKIFEGEVLGLVGETGCGKSVTALSILQLIKHPGKIENGKVIFNGENLLEKSADEISNYRGDKITMIFQDPLNSVNPVFKVGEQISEVYLLHRQAELFKAVEEYSNEAEKINLQIEELNKKISVISDKKSIFSGDTKGKEKNILDELLEEKEKFEKDLSNVTGLTSIHGVARKWTEELIRDVEIPDPEQIYDRYPHELSGGMRQRIMIAMGLACSPRLLIADEPTTALDVTIQNQILQLMKNLRKKYSTSILFITHDLGIISKMCDRVAVMYSGFIVEYGDIKQLFVNPYHPYTKGLISSVPVVGKKKEKLSIIDGMVPNLIYPPSGCRFHPRCGFCFEPCDSTVPKRIEIEPNYFVACHLYDSKYKDLVENSLKNTKKNKN